MANSSARVEARQTTVIKPYFIVPLECAKSCRRLHRVANEARQEALRNPNSQIVVITTKHSWFSCNASCYIEGMLIQGLQPGRLTYTNNPGVYRLNSEQFTVRQRIQQAISNGAQEYDDLPLR